jgi:hypothetical protein
MALLPSGPAAAGIAWPDGIGPGTFNAATVGAASVTAGKNHSCAITSLGSIYCWGDNSAGQLGDGAVSRDAPTAVPVSLAGDLGGVAVQVDAGDTHTCALDAEGTAYCWGGNDDGELGIASTSDAAIPAKVDTLADRTLVEITAGARHTCAIDDEGAAWCWGDNSAGQLGVPGQSPGTTIPVRVSTATGMTGPVVDIAAGGDTTCAATDDGAAYCWGEGDAGQLGDGADRDADQPVAVSTAGVLAGATVRQVAVGYAQACAVDDHGEVACWGDTANGRRDVPARANADGPRFNDISGGARHMCGLARGAVAYCWGSDVNGQLGDGATRHAYEPVRVAGGARGPDAELHDLEAGARHSCALDTRGVAYCWGADDEGQLGNGGGAASTVPVLVRGLPRPPAAVTGVRVTALDGGLRMSWRPATDLGSGSFIAYLAVTTDLTAGCQVATPGGTSCDLRGLANGVNYDVAVLTYTSDGTTLSTIGTAAPRPERSTTLAPLGGLPVTGSGPGLLIAAGCLLLALGLAALLVRKPT